jgi:hypothetical protein
LYCSKSLTDEISAPQERVGASWRFKGVGQIVEANQARSAHFEEMRERFQQYFWMDDALQHF